MMLKTLLILVGFLFPYVRAPLLLLTSPLLLPESLLSLQAATPMFAYWVVFLVGVVSFPFQFQFLFLAFFFYLLLAVASMTPCVS